MRQEKNSAENVMLQYYLHNLFITAPQQLSFVLL